MGTKLSDAVAISIQTPHRPKEKLDKVEAFTPEHFRGSGKLIIYPTQAKVHLCSTYRPKVKPSMSRKPLQRTPVSRNQNQCSMQRI